MTIGYALTGSFCTFNKSFAALKRLCAEHNITPICSFSAANTDTRFFKAKDTLAKLEEITGNSVIKTIKDAEPIGPKKLFDVLIVAPCTGNTAGKIRLGITDTPVTMAVKAHLRNNRPVVLAIATNDGLCGGAKNIAGLLERRNIYFVPFGQDDFENKPASIVAHFDMIEEAVNAAAQGKQVQPILIEY